MKEEKLRELWEAICDEYISDSENKWGYFLVKQGYLYAETEIKNLEQKIKELEAENKALVALLEKENDKEEMLVDKLEKLLAKLP